MKKKIWVEVTSLDVEYVFAEDVIATLAPYVAEHGPQTVRLEKRHHDYSESTYTAVVVSRDETDQEEESREARERIDKENREMRQRAQYEEMKKKYGDK